MKSEEEISEILVNGGYSEEVADDIIDSIPGGSSYDEMRGHILSRTGIDIDDY